MAEYQGILNTAGEGRWALVVSRFNRRVTERLQAGAIDQLVRHGAAAEAIDVFYVPGSWEIAGVVQKLLDRPYRAVIALGAVIRGETPHFDYVAANTASAIMELSRTAPIPVIFGVLTCNTMAEAEDRADGKAGNKGAEAALAAIEMADLYRRLASGSEWGPVPGA